MKAITQTRYGPTYQLSEVDVAAPQVGANEVLVRVHHAAANPADLYIVGGVPYLVRLTTGLRRPRQMIRLRPSPRSSVPSMNHRHRRTACRPSRIVWPDDERRASERVRAPSVRSSARCRS